MDSQLKTAPSQSFADFLVSNGYLKQEQVQELEKIEQAGGGSIATLLLQRKVLEEEDLTKAKAAFFNIPYVDLRAKQISTSVLNLIPQESINFYNFVPFEQNEHSLKVAITNPTNLSALEALEFLGQKLGMQVQLYLASETSVDIVIGKKRNLKKVGKK
jgi:hypothetical protein